LMNCQKLKIKDKLLNCGTIVFDDQVNKLVEQYYKNNNISFIDPIADHLEELKAAYPYGATGGPGFEMLYNARNIVGESLNKIESEKNEIFQENFGG
jgi:hypothetical protein